MWTHAAIFCGSANRVLSGRFVVKEAKIMESIDDILKRMSDEKDIDPNLVQAREELVAEGLLRDSGRAADRSSGR